MNRATYVHTRGGLVRGSSINPWQPFDGSRGTSQKIPGLAIYNWPAVRNLS